MVESKETTIKLDLTPVVTTDGNVPAVYNYVVQYLDTTPEIKEVETNDEIIIPTETTEETEEDPIKKDTAGNEIVDTTTTNGKIKIRSVYKDRQLGDDILLALAKKTKQFTDTTTTSVDDIRTRYSIFRKVSKNGTGEINETAELTLKEVAFVEELIADKCDMVHAGKLIDMIDAQVSSQVGSQTIL